MKLPLSSYLLGRDFGPRLYHESGTGRYNDLARKNDTGFCIILCPCSFPSLPLGGNWEKKMTKLYDNACCLLPIVTLLFEDVLSLYIYIFFLLHGSCSLLEAIDEGLLSYFL